MAKRTREPVPADAGPDFFRTRILERTDRSGECWLWTRPVNRMGYAQICVGAGKRVFAHRLSYEVFVGPIPAGLQIDHLCRVHHCVNPSHLEPVTARENIMRGECPTARVVRSGYCARGHRRTLANTSGTHCRECTRERERTGMPSGHPNARLTLAQRFQLKVKREGECHRWTGAISDGQGTIWHGGKARKARHVSLLLAGVEIPEGAVVRRADGCPNRDCVRPEHLELHAVRQAQGVN
jgi:hypothetical protein